MAGGAVTFSFDDGSDADVRVADELARRGLTATFYVTTDRIGTKVSWAAIHDLRARGMEIGAHTVSHVSARRVSAEAYLDEARRSKQILEDGLGEEIVSFCHPYGHAVKAHRVALAEMGYRVCRTTQAFATSSEFDPMAMPTSLNLYPHSGYAHVRHAVREVNPRISRWAGRLLAGTSTEQLVHLLAADAAEQDGLVHFWGHAVELVDRPEWRLLQRAVDEVSDLGLSPLTNGEAGAAAERRARVAS